jgi:hypothetical protein
MYEYIFAIVLTTVSYKISQVNCLTLEPIFCCMFFSLNLSDLRDSAKFEVFGFDVNSRYFISCLWWNCLETGKSRC